MPQEALRSDVTQGLQALEIPRHVAIIMDGNGRWAKQRGLPLILGHRKGAERAKEIAEYAAGKGIKYLTLYAFSQENWSRPEAWIQELMQLLRHFLQDRLEEIRQLQIRISAIGNKDRLPEDIVHLLDKVEAETIHYDRLHLFLALSYGGRDEIARAVQRIAHKIKDGFLMPQNITENVIADHLDTAGIPDPDLLVRTSGEMRISNFLLWQLAYAEFVFEGTYWPDFTSKEFEEAIQAYQKRQRRYGNFF